MTTPQTQHCIIPAELPSTTTPIHFLPCSIHYSGPAKLDRYFFPEVVKDYQENLSSTGELIEKPIPKTQYEQLEAVFRGHLIKGHKHELPSGTIGIILQSNSNQSTQSMSNSTMEISSQTTTTSNTNSTTAPTTLRRRGQKRSKQDLLFDEEDMNGGDNNSQVLLSQSQNMLSQQPTGSMTSATQLNHTNHDNNQTSISITHVFDAIHIWEPEVIEDQSLFEFRRQPIDEFIPLANALHSTSYNLDDE